MTPHCKRLIEVDLPIRTISDHARREKSLRHGHVSTLHLWWARRPLAACRSVVLAALWPDPADPLCPARFRTAAAETLAAHRDANGGKVYEWNDPLHLRAALLDFIGNFANWDVCNKKSWIDTARTLVQAAHESLGGEPGTAPQVLDPFAGGGAIPLEALRVGAEAIASDYNPVAVLLNKVQLEYIPRYGKQLATALREWGVKVKAEAEKELGALYPRDADGSMPIAYLWARTIRCEGPSCGVEVPMLASRVLRAKAKDSVWIRFDTTPNGGWTHAIEHGAPTPHLARGTVQRGAVTCVRCGFTTPVESVRRQLIARRGGTNDARMMAVVLVHPQRPGRMYRSPTEHDLAGAREAVLRLESGLDAERLRAKIPNAKVSLTELRRISLPLYGMTHWADAFSSRQQLVLATVMLQIERLAAEHREANDPMHDALVTLMALVVDRLADYGSAVCTWNSAGEKIRNTFARQAIGMAWDYVEVNPWAGATGGWDGALEWVGLVIEHIAQIDAAPGVSIHAKAQQSPLADDSIDAIVTDPPYYDAVPYAHLADFFYVWLRVQLRETHPSLTTGDATDKSAEIVVDRAHSRSPTIKTVAWYEHEMTLAFAEAARLAKHDSVSVVVFASKTNTSWEAILGALISAGWTIVAAWPIDTELQTRIAAKGQSRLNSSIHLGVRPRVTREVGDWRDTLSELPRCIAAWLPRMIQEGIVGADAIFACIGPALELFSRYSRVERADGRTITLQEYLEVVWTEVARQALSTIFHGADASDFDEPSRLSVMWLWSMSATAEAPVGTDDESDDTDDEATPDAGAEGTYGLSFDMARKVAMAVGADLAALPTYVEVTGSSARLISVEERLEGLFARSEAKATARSDAQPTKKAPTATQGALAFEGYDHEREAARAKGKAVPATPAVEAHRELVDLDAPHEGALLDRVHQSMLLFQRGRTAALKALLVDNGHGRDPRFWKLAQSLSALYPMRSAEKRMVDGVMARKRAMGL